MGETKKQGLLYIRVSTEEQVRYGLSIDAQEKALRDYCTANNYVVRDVYSDEGISGSTISKRLQFKRMVAEAKDGDTILFTKLDRFSRNLIDANLIVQELEAKNVMIKAINEDDIDTTTADGKFIFNLKLSLAQREREKTAERIYEVFEYKKARGEVVTGSIPLGYKIVDKHCVPDEETRPIVEFIFNTYDETNIVNETHRRFVEKYGNIRTRKSIVNIIRNRTYIGEKYGDPNWCEPLIDKALFERCNKRLGRNIKAPRTNNIYLFSRMIICPVCGRKLYAHGYTDYKRYTYYECASRLEKRCGFTQLREDKLEQQLLDSIQIFAEDKLYSFKQSGHKDYNKEIKTVQSKMKRLTELYIEGDIDKESYKAKKEAFEARLVELNTLATEYQNKALDEIVRLNIRQVYEALTKENKQAFWYHFIDTIHVNTDGEITGIDFIKF